MATKDWLDWHAQYDRPGSGMDDRLAEVQRCIAEMLDRAAPGPLRVVSICAGQGRDPGRHRRVDSGPAGSSSCAHRLVVPPAPYEPGVRLFTFRDELP